MPVVDGLPVVREAFPRTIRLVATARLHEPVLSPLADSEGELSVLAEIESATSGRRVAEERGAPGMPANELVHGIPHARFINASFAYAKPRQPNRLNGTDRGAWYAALKVKTCLAEVGYHLTKALADAGDFNAVVDYAEMHASMAGDFVDLRRRADHEALNPDPAIGYSAGNLLAAAVRGAGHNGTIYPSVRHRGGICIVALWPHVVQSVAQGDIFRLRWTGSASPEISRH
ncbi:MAG: RES family NAD+ phosphorylase [Sphingomicrobium sp.]